MATPMGDSNMFSILDEDLPTTKNNKRSTKRKAVEDFPVLPTKTIVNNEPQPRFITIQTTDEKKKLNEHNVFVVKKGVDAISRLYSKATFLRDGSLLVLCDNQSIANRFINTKTIANISVKITLHEKLNSSKGIIYTQGLKNLKEEEIKEGLKDQGVTEVTKILRKTPEGQTPTGLLILSFNSFTAPKYIYAGFERVEVREYIPNPMRCKKCQALGHTTKWCQSEDEICGNCAEKIPHEEKCGEKKCVNCTKPGHGSSDPKCPKYVLQKEFLKIKTRNHCTMYEAKQIYYRLNPGAAAKQPSYADITNKIKTTMTSKTTLQTNNDTETPNATYATTTNQINATKQEQQKQTAKTTTNESPQQPQNNKIEKIQLENIIPQKQQYQTDKSQTKSKTSTRKATQNTEQLTNEHQRQQKQAKQNENKKQETKQKEPTNENENTKRLECTPIANKTPRQVFDQHIFDQYMHEFMQNLPFSSRSAMGANLEEFAKFVAETKQNTNTTTRTENEKETMDIINSTDETNSPQNMDTQ